MPAMRRSLVVATSLAAACSTGEPPPTTVTYLTPTGHLARASLALRGIRPSLAELQAVAAEPDRVAALVDRYLESAAFGATIRDLHDDLLLLHPELTSFTPPPSPPLSDIAFTDMMSDEFRTRRPRIRSPRRA